MEKPKGKLIAVGGNEDKGSQDDPGRVRMTSLNFFELQILSRIIHEAGGKDVPLEVITTASTIPDEVGENYLQAFGKLGCTNVHVMHIKTNKQARDRKNLERIKNAGGVMFTGGNQLTLSTLFNDTEFLDILQKRYYNENFVIAGTSAGAMAMSKIMIYQGSSSEALLKGEVKITTGLSFLADVIIDSHFVKRGRFGRLAQAVAGNPSCIGLGLGEDTGVIITDGDHLEAIGSGLIIVFDGHKIKHNNIAELKDGAPISIENLIVHVLAKGNCYKLKKRTFHEGMKLEKV
jgi:cyanophycinase